MLKIHFKGNLIILLFAFRYGIKVWAACDTRTSYVLNAQVYLGKQPGEQREVGQAKRVVMDLVVPIRGSGRNITTDQHFTSVELARELKDSNLTIVGTINKQRRELPPVVLPTRDRPAGHTMFLFSGDITLISYTPRRLRSVTILSTLHHQAECEDDGKPSVIAFYNKTKGGVDTNDKLAHTYTVRRKCRRWPVVMFHHVIDLAAINGMVVWIKRKPTWEEAFHTMKKRKEYLFQLSEDLVKPYVQNRKMDRSHGMHRHVKRALDLVSTDLQEVEVMEQSQTMLNQSRKSCYLCPKKRRIYQQCGSCKKNICKAHSTVICHNCLSSHSSQS